MSNVTWDYRLVAVNIEGESWLEVRRVFYDKDSLEVTEVEEFPASPLGHCEHEIMTDLTHMLHAFAQPVLELSESSSDNVGSN